MKQAVKQLRDILILSTVWLIIVEILALALCWVVDDYELMKWSAQYKVFFVSFIILAIGVTAGVDYNETVANNKPNT